MHKAALMFLNSELARQEIFENILEKKFKEKRMVFYNDIIKHGFASFDVLEINNFINLEFESRCNKM